MALINLSVNMNVLDSPILEQTSFGPDMKNWISNTVDILNDEISSVITVVNIINNLFNNLMATGTIDAGGTFPIPFNVPILGLTPSGFVIAKLLSSTNPTTLLSVVPGVNQFTVTFSADPGASAIISYSVFSIDPQG